MVDGVCILSNFVYYSKGEWHDQNQSVFFDIDHLFICSYTAFFNISCIGACIGLVFVFKLSHILVALIFSISCLLPSYYFFGLFHWLSRFYIMVAFMSSEVNQIIFWSSTNSQIQHFHYLFAHRYVSLWHHFFDCAPPNIASYRKEAGMIAYRNTRYFEDK
jgi:hypothetical protein